jgi:hypothetical protein
MIPFDYESSYEVIVYFEIFFKNRYELENIFSFGLIFLFRDGF